MEFTDREIREELARLGYQDVPDNKLSEFKKDLFKLIQSERSKNSSLNSSVDESRPVTAPPTANSRVNDSVSDHAYLQWGGHKGKFNEDWNYTGKDDRSTRGNYGARGPAYSTRSYGLYEQPMDLHLESDDFRMPVDDAYVESSRKHVKRKTSRKSAEGSRTVDESFSDQNAAGIYEIYEKIRNMAMRDCECGKTRSTTAESEPPYRIRGENRCPSVIKPGPEHPHYKNVTKTLPWKRFQMYQRMWKMQPAIGEDARCQLRTEVKSKMLQKEEVKQHQKVYLPNSYVPPTEKPRRKLRWEVRKANAQYQMPPHGFYHEV